MIKRIISLLILIAITVIGYISIINYNAVNIESEGEILSVLQTYVGADSSVQIIESKVDRNEFFVTFKDGNNDIALAILEETIFSFGKYYVKSGWSKGGLINDYNFSQGVKDGKDMLLVAYGITVELEDNTYWVVFDGDVQEVNVDNSPYFLNVHRLFSDNPTSWGRIVYSSEMDILSKNTPHNTMLKLIRSRVGTLGKRQTGYILPPKRSRDVRCISHHRGAMSNLL